MEAKIMSDFNLSEKSHASFQANISVSKDGDKNRSQDAFPPQRKRENLIKTDGDICETITDKDVSALNRMIKKIHNLPEVRYELVDRVRRELHEGNYETPDKLDLAIQVLQEDFIE